MFLGVVVFAVGCASALKKQCESTNWFDQGYKIAMSGKRVSSDDFVASCKKEEVEVREDQLSLGFKAGMQNYCKPEIVFNTGKNGDFFNDEFCSSGVATLRKRHAEGVRVFCDSSNGYPFGATGKAYNQICPKDLEQSFLKEFRRGRKTYLGQMILGKEQEINELENEIADKEHERNNLNLQLMTLPNNQVVTQQSQYDPVTGARRDSVAVTQTDEIKNKRQSLEWDIQSVNTAIRELRTKQSALRGEIIKLKTEKEGLE